MSKLKIISFQEALKRTNNERRHLFLGNGFSMALFPDIFSYVRLLDSADFTSIPEAKSIFRILNTTDFEVVIEALKTSAEVIPAYSTSIGSEISSRMREHSEKIKDILVKVIASNHPSNPSEIEDEKMISCRRFLANFISSSFPSAFQGKIYSVNYDLLLYWVLMHASSNMDDSQKIKLHVDDGFRAPDEQDAEYVVWDGYSDSQSIRYFHGGLHLFDDGKELRKFCWERSGGIPLIAQIRDALSKNQFPLFISEGNSNDKLKKIRHSHVYLHSALKSFIKITGNLFIYGHSFSDNDDHILDIIPNGKITRLFVGVYGDPESELNKKLIQKAVNLTNKRKNLRNVLTVEFYSAESAHVWDAMIN
jgi:hypothetical protein